jgi:glycine/D-amino acid oxidase-like deaminating enzyme
VVEGWTVLPDGLVEVGTDRGTYRAEKLVLAGGAWMDKLVPELRGLCVPGRATVAWMQVRLGCKYAIDQREFVVVLVLRCQGIEKITNGSCRWLALDMTGMEGATT